MLLINVLINVPKKKNSQENSTFVICKKLCRMKGTLSKMKIVTSPLGRGYNIRVSVNPAKSGKEQSHDLNFENLFTDSVNNGICLSTNEFSKFVFTAPDIKTAL